MVLLEFAWTGREGLFLSSWGFYMPRPGGFSYLFFPFDCPLFLRFLSEKKSLPAESRPTNFWDASWNTLLPFCDPVAVQGMIVFVGGGELWLLTSTHFLLIFLSPSPSFFSLPIPCKAINWTQYHQIFNFHLRRRLVTHEFETRGSREQHTLLTTKLRSLFHLHSTKYDEHECEKGKER